RAVGLLRLARAAEIDGEAAKVLRVLRQLEGVACVVRRQVRNEDERFPVSLLLVIHRDPAGLNARHGIVRLVSPTIVTPKCPACKDGSTGAPVPGSQAVMGTGRRDAARRQPREQDPPRPRHDSVGDERAVKARATVGIRYKSRCRETAPALA